MSTTTETPTTTTPQAPRARSTGEAVHDDLYKPKVDPAVERAALREEAKKLGYASFFVFFVLIGGISLGVNGAYRGGWAVDAPTAVVPPAIELLWADGGRTSPAFVEPVDDVAENDVTPAQRKGLARIDVFAPVDGRLREAYTLWAARQASGARLASVGLVREGGAGRAGPDVEVLAASPHPRHALDNARLARILPTRVLMTIGAILGLLGVVAPSLLIPYYKFWMGYVGAPLGWFNTRLILGLVFFIMFTPFALVLKIKRALNPGADPLARAPHEGSYWKRRAQQRPRTHFERLF